MVRIPFSNKVDTMSLGVNFPLSRSPSLSLAKGHDVPSLFLGPFWSALALAVVAAIVSFLLEASQLHGALASVTVGLAVGITGLLIASRYERQGANPTAEDTVSSAACSLSAVEASSVPQANAHEDDFVLPQDEQKQKDLYRRVTTDPLTGLANRLHFQARFEEVVAQSNRDPGRQVSLALFSFDTLPSASPVEREAYLVSIAATCRPNIRPGDVVSRLDENLFALLLPNAGPRAAMACADRLRHALSVLPRPSAPAGSHYERQTPHYFGVATLKAGENTDDLQQRANLAMASARTAPHERILFASNAPPLQ